MMHQDMHIVPQLLRRRKLLNEKSVAKLLQLCKKFVHCCNKRRMVAFKLSRANVERVVRLGLDTRYEHAVDDTKGLDAIDLAVFQLGPLGDLAEHVLDPLDALDKYD